MPVFALFTVVSLSSLTLLSLDGVRALPTLCFEKLSNTSAIEMAPHPNGKYAVIGTQAGVLSLVTLPAVNSKSSGMAPVSTWLDLSPRVLFNRERGLLGFAFHPRFRKNGRFFVSYICNAKLHPDCAAPCACNKGTGCRVPGCSDSTIIAEYTVFPRSPSPSPLKPSAYLSLNPREVKRILSFGRPYSNHNGGYIFFGRRDGYLYYTSGDGGGRGDPWNMAQKGNVFLGKILRIDVDGGGMSAGNRGNYTIPKNNPFWGYKTPAGAPSPVVFPEVFALGLRNPWRCDQDEVTGRIICGDVGQNTVEEVDFIFPGWNYAWHLYEGSVNYSALTNSHPPGGFTNPKSMIGKGIQITPLMEYTHGCTVTKGRKVCLECVTGGVVYRANRNKCLQGKYICNDLYGPMFLSDVYSGKKLPLAMPQVPFKCAPDSPLPCPLDSEDVSKKLPMFWSWAKDLNGEAYVMGAPGLFRLVDLSRCGFLGC